MSNTQKNQEIHLDNDGTSTNIVYGDIANISMQKGIFHVGNWGGLGPVDMPKTSLVGEYQGKKYFHVGRNAWYPWEERDTKGYWPLPHR